MRRSTSARLESLLTTQDGVVTRGQLRALGVDHHLAGREGWLRLASGVWLDGAGPPSDRQLLWASRLHVGPGAVVTGALACRCWKLRDAPVRPVADVLVPNGRRHRAGPHVMVHQSTRPLPFSRPGSLPLVEPARAVADAARWSRSLREVRALVLGAVADGRVTVGVLREELAAGGRRGSTHLARSLVDAERGAASAPEAEAVDALLGLPRGQRLPPLLVNPALYLDGRLLGRPDVYLPDLGLGGELDSERHHGSTSDLDQTLLRHGRFADARLELTHVTPARLRADPVRWARDFAERARRRAEHGLAPPHGLVVVPAGPLLVSPA